MLFPDVELTLSEWTQLSPAVFGQALVNNCQLFGKAAPFEQAPGFTGSPFQKTEIPAWEWGSFCLSLRSSTKVALVASLTEA